MVKSWNKLSLFESTDLIKKSYKQLHERELNSGKALEIVCAFTQGKEYFHSASSAGEFVRPLLQYYGVLSLSRGLVLFRSRDLRETSLSPSHGLSQTSWNDVLSKGLKEFSALTVTIKKKGSFLQLLDATQNTERSYISCAPRPRTAVLTRTHTETLLDGTNIKLKDIFGRIANLYEIYESTFGEQPQCCKGEVFNLSPITQTDISIFKGRLELPSEETIRTMFSINPAIDVRLSQSQGFITPQELWTYRIQHSCELELLKRLPTIENDENGQMYLIAPFPGGLYFSGLAKLFMLSYILSMIVRYYPSQWLALQTPGGGDSICPLIKEALALVQNQFPRLVLEDLKMNNCL